MWPNPQFTADLLTFTEEILNRKVIFCAVIAAGFYIFYHICSDLDQIFKNKSRCNSFNLVIVTSNKAYFISSLKALNAW